MGFVISSPLLFLDGLKDFVKRISPPGMLSNVIQGALGTLLTAGILWGIYFMDQFLTRQ